MTPSARILPIALLLAAYAVPQAHADYSLVWADEFNGTSLDTNNWNTDIGNGCPSLCGWGNNELQYYRSQNVTVSGGNLVLTARAESFSGYSYTSGKVTTRNKQSFLYGRIEMRAKIPTGGGMWPAFWMMPQDDVYGGWAASGEIDIMEAANATTSVGGTIHYGGAWPANTYAGGSTSLGGANFADAFHIYAVEWEPDAIRWYVDGVLYYTRTSAQWFSDGAPGNPRAPFDQEFYILLNAAVGGNYTGCTSPGCITASFPQEYLIDYVRVYEDIPNSLPLVSITAPAAGSSLPAGDVTITATASDSDGSIATVEFYNGATLLGEDTTAPYTFLWGSVPSGCYDIEVRAIDNLGGTSTDGVDITVGAGCGQVPFAGSPFVFPTVIQAEDYDEGGDGVAYFDQDASNNGGQYRPAEGVDIEVCTDSGGGYNVGWLNPGEWVEYSVSVPSPGTYDMTARVASQSAGGTFHLEFNGSDQTGVVAVPVTGGWQTWTTVSFSATLTAGSQIMRFAVDGGEFNVNSFEVAGVPTAVPPGNTPDAVSILRASPNPFSPRTTISYELDAPATVDLSIFDARGRRVQTLVGGQWLAAGEHQVTWDGRDAKGRAVAGGVYFSRLDTDTRSATLRIVLLK